jgi:hypothetical protein
MSRLSRRTLHSLLSLETAVSIVFVLKFSLLEDVDLLDVWQGDGQGRLASVKSVSEQRLKLRGQGGGEGRSGSSARGDETCTNMRTKESAAGRQTHAW